MTKLSVVILNYNVRYFLELCLKSVLVALKDLDAEVIVVDNHSSDDSCEMVKRLFPNIKLIENKENFGFSKGNNIGVSHAVGHYICILNPDTVVAEDTFKEVLAYAANTSEMGVLGCRLIDGKGRFLPESKRHIPTPKVAIKKMLGFSNGYYAKKVDESSIAEVEILVGAFMFLKKELYKKVDGFDEDYFMYGEDIDLSYRILKAGHRNIYYGRNTIIHYKGESTLKDKIYAERFYGAMQIFYNKHFKSRFVFDLLVKLGIRFSRLSMRKSRRSEQKIPKQWFMTTANEFTNQGNFEKNRIGNLENADAGTQVIFDANSLSFKEIIQSMSSVDLTKDLSFRILPEDANFIIGSDSPELPGEVLFL